MKPISLKLRLFTVSVFSILLALTIAGYGISALFATHIKTNLTKDLSDQFDQLVVLLDPQNPIPTLTSPIANPSFSVPYGGFYWQITNVETLEQSRSRSMWDAQFPAQDISVLDGRQHTISLIDPEGTEAIAIIQRLQFSMPDGTFSIFDIIIAEDLNLMQEANRGFRNGLIQSLALLALALAFAAWVQMSMGLAPFSRIKSDIKKIRDGATKRMNTNHPPEVMPLVEEVNELLQTQEKTISFARTRASNLAHALKTHLSILQTEVEKLRNSGHDQNAIQIEKLGDEMHNVIDHQLRLSRLRTRSAGDYFSSGLKTNTSKIVSALQRTSQSKTIEWVTDIREDIHVDIDTPDLLELMGIILENAAKWAKSRVVISAKLVENRVEISVQDDGNGLSEQKLKLLGQRGLRLDQSSAGSGIGLAIANEIITMNRGQISFSSEKPMGLNVTISLPSSTKPGN